MSVIASGSTIRSSSSAIVGQRAGRSPCRRAARCGRTCGRDSKFGPAAGAEEDEVGGRRRRAMRPQSSSRRSISAGVAATARRPVGDRVIEMQDARRLAEHLEHVEIAIGIERIAGVVGGDGDRHAARLQLVQQRHAAPARRACSARRSCRYMLHIGSETTAMPAFATLSSVVSPRRPAGAPASSNGRRGCCPRSRSDSAASAMCSQRDARRRRRSRRRGSRGRGRARRPARRRRSSSCVEVRHHDR